MPEDYMALQEQFDQALANDTLHPAQRQLLKYFAFGHLPEFLQRTSRRFCGLAIFVAQDCPGAEGTVALRKLLEAKDAAVRSMLP